MLNAYFFYLIISNSNVYQLFELLVTDYWCRYFYDFKVCNSKLYISFAGQPINQNGKILDSFPGGIISIERYLSWLIIRFFIIISRLNSFFQNTEKKLLPPDLFHHLSKKATSMFYTTDIDTRATY